MLQDWPIKSWKNIRMLYLPLECLGARLLEYELVTERRIFKVTARPIECSSHFETPVALPLNRPSWHLCGRVARSLRRIVSFIG